MTQSKFLQELRRALGGKLPAGQVQENITYYENYIKEEIRNGRQEKEVLDELGDPWILAKTLTDIGGSSSGNYMNAQDSSDESGEKKNISDTMKKIMAVVGIILIILVIIMVVRGLMKFIMPIAIPLIAVYIIYKIVKSK